MEATSSDRLDLVDVLRGFALIGVFAANLLVFSGYIFMSDDQRAVLSTVQIDRVVGLVELVLIENKFIGLFSILFGVSFWLFLDRVNARGSNGVRLFYSRIFWLFVIGAVHGWLFWAFDILRFYALFGLFLPLFVKVPKKVLLGVALFVSVLLPALVSGARSQFMGPAPAAPSLDAAALQAFSSGSYSEFLRVNWLYDWYLTLSIGQIGYQAAVFGRLLLGLFAARALVLADVGEHRQLFRWLLITGGLIGIAANIVIAGQYLEQSTAENGFFLPFSRRLIAEAGYLSLTIAYASVIALLFQGDRWKRILLSLAPIGRMALTFYLLQTLFGLWLFYGFIPGPHLMGKVGPAWLAVVWAIGYALQVWLAAKWLRAFRFGPAEWVWRCLTYWKLQPFRRLAQNI
jgi:uncharacterized protein